MKKLVRWSVLALLSLSVAQVASAADKLKVVATFSVLGDVVQQIGQDQIELHTLVGKDSDVHVYSPTPSDIRNVAHADLLIMSGLGLEGWMSRLQQSSGFKGDLVVASKGIEPLAMAHDEHEEEHHHDHDGAHEQDEHHDHDGAHEHDEHHDHDGMHEHHDEHEMAHHHHHHGKYDPHVWHNVDNVIIYAKNVQQALSTKDPAHKAFYQANAKAYIQKLEGLKGFIQQTFANIPEQHRKIITSHDAFGYFAKAYHLQFIAPQGTSTAAEASARDVAAIISQIKENQISAVFIENISDSRLIEQISRETHAKVGGELYSDALSAKAPTYIEMMKHNVTTIAKALNHNK